MKISEIAANQGNISLEVAVKEVGPVKEFSKFGRTGRVVSATIKDDSGEMKLALWDDEIDLVKKGDKIRIINAYVKEWQGEKQLNIGRSGSIEAIE